MGDFPTSVMLALLPETAEWCHIDLPHMTLVYCGELSDLKETAHNELAKIALSFAFTAEPLTLFVTGTEVFGDIETDQVDVLTLLASSDILAMRSMVEDWSVSDYSFNPHVTVGPVGSVTQPLPASITFDRIAVGWGDSLLTYKFIG